MAHRSMKPELTLMHELKMYLFDLRLEVSKGAKFEKWTLEELLKVLKCLKKNKSADSQGLTYYMSFSALK